MITFFTVHSIAYYDSQFRKAQADSRLFEPGLRYFDDDSTSAPGKLYRLKSSVASTFIDPARDPFEGVCDGAEAHSNLVQFLAVGQSLSDPTAKLKRSKGKPVVAFDVQISLDKGLTVLALLSPPEIRDVILTAHDEAVEKVLRLAALMGLVITRRGAQSSIKEPAAEVVVAAYRHLTSRDNDPHVHSHSVMFNLCRRQDGQIGAIDSHRLLQFGGALAALYRCEVVDKLRQKLLIEVSTRDGERNFTVAGMPTEVPQLFSKRRQGIMARAKKLGFSTADNREGAKIASLDTRQAKDRETPLPSLIAGWHQELANIGYSIDDLWTLINDAAGNIRAQSPRTRLTFQLQGTVQALERARENSIVVTEADITRVTAESRQADLGADAVLALVPNQMLSFVALPGSELAMRRFIHTSDIRLEHELLTQATLLRGQWLGPPNATIDAVLDGHPTASDEQKLAVRHMLNSDGVAVAEGSAGSGKSFTTGIVREILERAGFSVFVAAPSWTAARVAARESGVSAKRAEALAPLLLRLKAGKLNLTPKDVVIVDESGMSGLRDAASLIDIAAKAGAKIILTGDTRQLQSVAAGAPMRVLSAVLGSNRIDQIRRQHQTWMRDASMSFAQNRADEGIQAYVASGRVGFARSHDDAVSAATEDYLSHLGIGPAARLPDKTVSISELLLITARNSDVCDLNAAVRNGLRTAGYLVGDDVHINAVPRGSQSPKMAVDLALAINDRVIFGERLAIDGIEVYNSDIATVTALRTTSQGPQITFVLDRRDDANGPISFTAAIQDLASRRPKGGSAVPQLQHAYAVTAYAAQGATVDRTIVVNLHRTFAEETYVAFTRHRHELSVHVDASRFIGKRSANRIEVRGATYVRGPDDSDAAAPLIELDEAAKEKVIKAIKREATTSRVTSNPSDFLADRHAWLASDRPIEEFKRQLAPKTPAAPIGAQLINTTEQPVDIPLTIDPLRMSSAEIKRLSKISMSAALTDYFRCAKVSARFLDPAKTLYRSPGARRLLAVDPQGKPTWSRSSERLLVDRGARGEPITVQMAIIFLQKTLRNARAWVRRHFGLCKLNPFAALDLKRQAKQRQADGQSVDRQMQSLWSNMVLPATRGYARCADDDFETSRHRRMHFLRKEALSQIYLGHGSFSGIAPPAESEKNRRSEN